MRLLVNSGSILVVQPRFLKRGKRLTRANQPPVFIVRPNPKPFRSATFHNGEGAIVVSDARRPEVSNLFEVQRGMTRVAQPQFEVLSSEALDLWRQP